MIVTATRRPSKEEVEKMLDKASLQGGLFGFGVGVLLGVILGLKLVA